MEKTERLQKMRIFKDFGADEIGSVAKAAVEKIYPAGSSIVKEGELGEGLFTIFDGEVNVNKRLPDSPDTETLAVLKTGDHFGEMGLIDGKTASATILANKPTICFVIKRKEYYELLAREPIIAMKLYRFYTSALCERLRRTDAFLLDELKRNKGKIDRSLLHSSA